MTRQEQITRKPRRKPVQSRSQQTSIAIQDAFVRLLGEAPYGRITIREIVQVAGVGLGTFYDYFDGKDDLARTCVHLRTKNLLQSLRRRRAELAGCGLAEGIAGVVDSQLSIIKCAPKEWTQHFLLERQKTDLRYYQSAYELFVEECRRVIVSASDWPSKTPAEEPARQVFTLIYGAIAHALLRAGPKGNFEKLRREIIDCALNCLASYSAAGTRENP